jgi:hypothetical protein
VTADSANLASEARPVRMRRVRQRLIAKRSYGLAKPLVEDEAGSLCGGKEGDG